MRVVCVRQKTALRIRKEHFVMVGAACGKYLMKLRNASIGKKHTAQLVVIRLAFQRHSTETTAVGSDMPRLTRLFRAIIRRLFDKRTRFLPGWTGGPRSKALFFWPE
jgi:hypothetical protein